MPPEPGNVPPVRTCCLHLYPDAGQPAGGEAGLHPPGERLRGEHHRLGLAGWRIEVDMHGEVS